MDWFTVYRDEFEKALVRGVITEVLGSLKPVPILPGKLSRKRIGKTMGSRIETDEVVVIDYYGYMKKSRGFGTFVKEVQLDQKGKQVKMINAPIVHFNSIRLEVIAKISPELVQKFGDFKKAVLDAREFKHNYKI